MNIKRKLGALLYYTIAKRLPCSYSGIKLGQTSLRRLCGKLMLAHMGWVFFKVEFEGKSCHSGGKKNGVNAIEKAIKVIQALNEMEHNWLLEYKHPLLPPPNLNIGVIEGGTAGSTVPDYCSFSTCVHYIPNMV